MGCGASSDPKVAVADSVKPINNNNNNKSNSQYNSQNRNNQNRNGFREVNIKNNSADDNSNSASNSRSDDRKAPLAFVISFDENKKIGNQQRPPPGRLQLEPLKHQPREIQAQLDEKMRAAELKREQILAKRVKSSNVKKRSNIERGRGDDNSDPDSRRAYDRDEEHRQRLLKQRRIVAEPDDDDIEHDRNYNRDSDSFNEDRRRYK